MPGTDDIAEKIAETLFEQSARLGGTAVGVISDLFKGASSASSEALSHFIDEIKKNKALKEMMGLEGEVSVHELNEIVRKFAEKSSSVLVGDADAADYEKLLREQGVLFAKADRVDDDVKMFIFLNRDLEKVEKATTILSAMRGQVTELNPNLYFNSLSPDKVHIVQGLNAEETELFRHFAREQGLLFTVVARKDDYMLVCNEADKQKARKALLYAGWALSGPNGARVKEQVQYRLSGRSAIQIAAEEGERELYIVSGKRPDTYVQITSEDFKVYKHNKQVATTSRKDPDFYARCMAVCDALPQPVVLSQEEFRPNLTTEDLSKAPSTELFPPDFDEIVEMERVNRLVNLVAMKSGLDNDHNATWGLWDPSVSYSEFSSYEFFSDQDEREAREYEFEHFKQAAYYSQNRHSAHDVNMEEKSVDFIIAKAEEKRRKMTAPEGRDQPRITTPVNTPQKNESQDSGRI